LLILVRLLSEAKCLNAASRRHGPSQDCYIVRDANGHALAYVYFEDERSAAHLMTRDEARRIAASSGPARGILRRIESAGRSAPARTGASGRSST
jgi:YD repeat-containing protein